MASIVHIMICKSTTATAELPDVRDKQIYCKFSEAFVPVYSSGLYLQVYLKEINIFEQTLDYF